MKKAVLALGLWSFAASVAWAGSVYRYDDISRRSGGSTFEETGVNVITDQIRIDGISGRLELEDIQVYTANGYKADLLTLIEEDSRNSVIRDLRGFFGADAKPGEPQALTVYLPQVMEVTDLVIQIESWANGARVQVLLQGDPSPNPLPDPVTGPICNIPDLTDRILQCGEDLSQMREDNSELEYSIRPLRDQVQRENARLRSCQIRNSELENDIVRIERDNVANATSIRRNIADNRRVRRVIRRIENPIDQWECYVQSRQGDKWTATGTNRAQLLQKLVRNCQAKHEHACGNRKWNPNDKKQWGCRPVRDDQGNIPGDVEDDEDQVKDDDGKRRQGGRRDGRGRRGGNS